MSIDAVTALLMLAFGAGVCVRFSYVLAVDFPLNDGGLFYAMTRDIQSAGYTLPAFTNYNSLHIPFDYPPLGFYVAAAIDDLTPVGLLDVFRFFPLVVTCLTVPAFYFLAKSLLNSRLSVAIAVLAFALAPRSYIWLLMGGGVTRSFGLLFALLALQQAVLLFKTGKARFAFSAGILSGLTVLSHGETGFFLAFSLVVLFFGLGANLERLKHATLIAVIGALILMPWLVTVLANNGLEPLLAAQSTGGSVLSSGRERMASIMGVLHFVSTSEPLFPVIGVLAFLGVLVCVLSRRFLLPAWWASIIFLDLRAFPTFTMVPIAMLAGIGFVEVVLPAVRAAVTSSRDGQELRRPALAPVVVTAFFAVYLVGRLFITDPGQANELVVLKSVSREERAAMTWVSKSTPVSSRFLIVPDSSWETARTSEWFPVLARRTSVTTVQGSEWLPKGSFTTRVNDYYTAFECGYGTTDCLDTWQLAGGPDFSHVYLAKSPVQCCSTLLASLQSVAAYELIYDGPGATIFARKVLSDSDEPATLRPTPPDISGLP